ncbi:MAG: dihydrolipoyl dehydrogenase [Bacillota bacterium]
MFDVIVIGGGPGGYVAAIRGAHLGGKVALVEGAKLGGTCLNVGCIPTKALVHSAHTLNAVKDTARFGVVAGEPRLDLSLVMAHKDQTVKQLVAGVEALVKRNGIQVYEGWAKVPSPGIVEVQGRDGSITTLESKSIILATGSSPRSLPLSSESLSNTVSSDDALGFDEVPKNLVVIGGGVLGVEFACIWNAFGSRVDIIELMPKILPVVDDEISRRLTSLLKRKGITVNLETQVREIRQEGQEKVVLADTKYGKTKEFRADKVLLAVGREPNFGGIDLDALGIRHHRRGIEVNDKMETSVPGIYAVGDVVGRTFLAHGASAEGLVAMENILGSPTSMDYSVVPSCVFSIPECASVGITESAAREQGFDVVVSKFPFGANGRALSMGETEGFVKIVGDRATGRILGMHILGPHADDLIHEGALALKANLTANQVADMIHAHPTLSEAVQEAFHGVLGKPLHLITR